VQLFNARQTSVVEPAEALPGRSRPIEVAERHLVLGNPLRPPFPEGVEQAIFGMGCFWGAERIFWEAPSVYTTAVGYAGGITPNPTYEEVCSGRTGHAEVVLVAFDSQTTGFAEMLKLFWEGHDPTQGMRQGNDRGTQYRSLIICSDAGQLSLAESSRAVYERMLEASGHGPITTEILAPEGGRASNYPFYYAEDYHQQYLEKNPGGYCGLGGTGVACPVGLTAS
jgi:peptide-methionine (S)-S-oxide reductase